MGRRKKINGKMLKQMRESTRFTQEQWGAIVGISRETVSAIENEKPGTIDAISAEVLAKWFEYSSVHLDQPLKQSFTEMITTYFGFFR